MSTIDKDWRPSRSEAAPRHLADRAQELRSALRYREPGLVAVRSGVNYLALDPGRGELHIPLWGKVCALSWPELTGCGEAAGQLSDFQQTLLLYYLITADGAPLTDHWVSFADLPGGRIYHTAFQGYTGDELVKTFGLELDSFKQACCLLGGRETVVGDASFIFEALPRIPLMVTYWLGDEDFPSSCKILFDASACHYLPIDGCALLGSGLVRKLLRS